jgi:antirestriction protein ArdC
MDRPLPHRDVVFFINQKERNTMKKRMDINKMITERLIERINESGSLPWKKPWSTPDLMPCNLISKKNYRGINAFLLFAMGYDSPWWLTMKQVNSLGGKVRKGEHSTPVVFWKIFEPDDDEQTEETPKRSYAMLRYYRVFNAVQCTGLKVQNVGSTAPETPSDRSTAYEVAQGMPDRPEVKFGHKQASYNRVTDQVKMPAQTRFHSPDEFFATLFHELAHSTGHSSRLNRKSLMESKGFESEPYSHEELVAEMAAGFLCGHCGILASVENNSAAYLKHWIEKLEAEPSLLLKAGSQAQKAFDYITGESKTPAPQKTGLWFEGI